jgi:hypothetical protein
LRLSDNPELVRNAPAPPTLLPAEQIHHTVHRHTLTTTLRRREAQTQAAVGGGILIADIEAMIAKGVGDPDAVAPAAPRARATETARLCCIAGG